MPVRRHENQQQHQYNHQHSHSVPGCYDVKITVNNITTLITITFIITTTTLPIQYGDNQGKLELLTPRSDNSQQLRCLGETEVVVLRTVKMSPMVTMMTIQREKHDNDGDNRSGDYDSPGVTR